MAQLSGLNHSHNTKQGMKCVATCVYSNCIPCVGAGDVHVTHWCVGDRMGGTEGGGGVGGGRRMESRYKLIAIQSRQPWNILTRKKTNC